MKRASLIAAIALFATTPALAGDGCGSMKGHPKMTDKGDTLQNPADPQAAWGAEDQELFNELHALPPGHPSIDGMDAGHSSDPAASARLKSI